MAGHLRFLNPKTIAPPPGYSYVVETSGAVRTVYLAGQLGVDMDNKFVGAPGDFRAQCVQAHDNLTLALEAVGATWADVVKINNFLVDIAANIAVYREVRGLYLNAKAPPVSTTIGVPDLARPGGLFEIEAIAVLPARPAAKAASRAAAKAKAPAKTSKAKSKKKKR